MFKELAPYLRHRAVLLTVTHLEEDQIRVNFVPKKLKDGENEALTTPLSITGTAEELDAELPSTLVSYVASHLQLKNTLENAKAEMEAAAKTAQAEARAKSKASGKKEPAAGTQPSAHSDGSDKPAEQPKPVVPRSPSLFDMAPAPTPATPGTPALSSSSGFSEESEEDDILAEIEEESDGIEDLEDAA